MAMAVCQEKDSKELPVSQERVSKELRTQNYVHQERTFWPAKGCHILAHYDEDSVVVYQAFCPAIAEYAVEHQAFGGDRFSYSRMSWIKTNFLWMMYRSGWASKQSQERVLAVWIKREGFEEILRHAFTGKDEKKNAKEENGKEAKRVQVRLQWDPDHNPWGEKEGRRAIQLGLRDEILLKYGKEWIVQIKDITSFVKEGHWCITKSQKSNELETPEERVYEVSDELVREQIHLDTV